ncbi:hypothetical protein HY502_01955 [Candidatus Woesebacteria bacterium]|nr:hypothetical protein [Candidatus Woesebacteria bacterium]
MLEFLFPFLDQGILEGLYIISWVVGSVTFTVALAFLVVAVFFATLGTKEEHDFGQKIARISLLVMLGAPFLAISGLWPALIVLMVLGFTIYIIIRGIKLAA